MSALHGRFEEEEIGVDEGDDEEVDASSMVSFPLPGEGDGEAATADFLFDMRDG
jgi:hypothetical protein